MIRYLENRSQSNLNGMSWNLRGMVLRDSFKNGFVFDDRLPCPFKTSLTMFIMFTVCLLHRFSSFQSWISFRKLLIRWRYCTITNILWTLTSIVLLPSLWKKNRGNANQMPIKYLSNAYQRCGVYMSTEWALCHMSGCNPLFFAPE